jgi:hypothetical protein
MDDADPASRRAGPQRDRLCRYSRPSDRRDGAGPGGRGLSGEAGRHAREARASADADTAEGRAVHAQRPAQYVYADPETCKCLYVGDEQRYQKFQELSLQKKIADEQMSAAQTNWDASMNWGLWGPWGW